MLLPSPVNFGECDTTFKVSSTQSGDSASIAIRSSYGKVSLVRASVLVLRTTDYDGDRRQCRDPLQVEAQQCETSRSRRDRRIGSLKEDGDRSRGISVCSD